MILYIMDDFYVREREDRRAEAKWVDYYRSTGVVSLAVGLTHRVRCLISLKQKIEQKFLYIKLYDTKNL